MVCGNDQPALMRQVRKKVAMDTFSVIVIFLGGFIVGTAFGWALRGG